MNCRTCIVLARVFICGTSISAVAQKSSDFKQGCTDEFNDGFDEDCRKAKSEQGAHNAAASKSFPIAATGATYRGTPGRAAMRIALLHQRKTVVAVL